MLKALINYAHFPPLVGAYCKKHSIRNAPSSEHEFFNYFLLEYSDNSLEQWKSDLTEPLQFLPRLNIKEFIEKLLTCGIHKVFFRPACIRSRLVLI
jgi:hypothetical protein